MGARLPNTGEKMHITENAFDPPIAQSAMDHRVVEIVGISDGYI